MTAPDVARTATINNWPAIAYGRAWIVSSPGGKWTCLEPGCAEVLQTSVARGKTDEERDEDAARLHAFAREHRHDQQAAPSAPRRKR